MRAAGFADSREALAYLDGIGACADAEIDVFEAALALSASMHPGLGLDKYRNHRKRLVADVETVLAQDGAAPDHGIDRRMAALAEVFTRRHGYIGDDHRYNDLQNADLVRVIDRRLGLPVTLSVICLALARDLGWQAQGLNFPGHFLMRLEQDGERRIVDPFQGCVVLGAPGLRSLLKKELGPGAELSAAYYEPADNRATLLRLHNNVKYRQIDAEDYGAALSTVELMRRFAPGESRLDLDAGVLLARLGRAREAIDSLERYMERGPAGGDRGDVRALLQELRRTL